MQTNGRKIETTQEISLYFHIPFCTKKCHYCHFYVIPEEESSKQALFHAFQKEWESWLPHLKSKNIATVYFGGGTPSLFGPKRIGSLLEMITKELAFSTPSPEITLEANPEELTHSLIAEFAAAGINRISIGIQTLDDELLHHLGRLHTSRKAIEAVYQTIAGGISNISIDLMYDLPHQTIQHWENTLQRVSELPITHLSLYNMTIEPHTQFFKQKEILSPHLPDETTSLRMYETAVDVLEGVGLNQYEISAFAQNGFEAKHNKGYWTGRPFLGFGPSAFSYWENKRFRNIANLNRYCQAIEKSISPVDFEEKLVPIAHLRELLVIQLRLKAGVDLNHFQQTHGDLDQETQQTIKKLVNEGFLNLKNDLVSLTRRGILFYDTVASELV